MRSEPGDRAAEAHVQAARLRSRLFALCEYVAEVEDGLADTLSEIAVTVSEERAGRLVAQAAEARRYAATERARARRFAD